ncbi:MAG: ECF transporter S component [Eubacteriales bacterium]|nr:ECF transporter S component [Eubacteriales bacterium]
MKEKMSVQKLCVDALMIALVCITTAVIQIPIPLGYMHLGNVTILAAGVFFGPMTGLLTGGIGSALADLLTGYAVWALPTLIIKSVMGYVIGRAAWSVCRNPRFTRVSVLLGSLAGLAVMVIGYTVFGSLLYGSVAAGLSQVPGLVTESVMGLAVFYVIAAAFTASHVTKLFVRLSES